MYHHINHQIIIIRGVVEDTVADVETVAKVVVVAEGLPLHALEKIQAINVGLTARVCTQDSFACQNLPSTTTMQF